MIFFKILLFLGKWGCEVRVLRDDGDPFQLIVGRPRRQSEGTVPLVSLRGSRDANGTTVDAPDTRCFSVEVCEGAERAGDRRLAWAREENCREVSRRERKAGLIWPLPAILCA